MIRGYPLWISKLIYTHDTGSVRSGFLLLPRISGKDNPDKKIFLLEFFLLFFASLFTVLK